uniref:MARVEL domain-containing protein n=1 Tax=Parastrongyloides trichosuri TaxID=131310 RepID=A0A0N4ZDR3_PARTI
MNEDVETNGIDLKTFKEQKKYRCLCGCLHIKNGAFLMSLWAALLVFLNITVKIIGFTETDWNWMFLFLITDGVSVLSLIYGIKSEKPALIQPFVVLSILTISLLFLLVIFFSTAIVDQESYAGHYIETEFIRKTFKNFNRFSSTDIQHEIKISAIVYVSFLSTIALLHIWFSWISFKCASFYRDCENFCLNKNEMHE